MQLRCEVMVAVMALQRAVCIHMDMCSTTNTCFLGQLGLPVEKYSQMQITFTFGVHVLDATEEAHLDPKLST